MFYPKPSAAKIKFRGLSELEHKERNEASSHHSFMISKVVKRLGCVIHKPKLALFKDIANVESSSLWLWVWVLSLLRPAS